MICQDVLDSARGWPNYEWLERFIHEMDTVDLSRNSVRRLQRRLTTAVNNRKLLDSVYESPMESPVIIVGLPRTGTTHLHDLLALVPGWRAPTIAECRQPFLPAEAALAEAKAHLKFTYAIVPNLRAIHPMRADGPEELRVLLEPSFQTQAWTLHYPAPRYSAQLDASDMSYAWYLVKRLLSHLDDDRRWVLKDTSHTGHIGELLGIFPNATVVWTHRDPVDATASLLSLLDVTFNGLSRELAQFIVAKNLADLRQLHRTMAAVDCIHIDYDDLVHDPLRVVYRVTEAAVAEVDEPALRRWMMQHPKDEHGAHRYSATDYGLDEAAVETVFGGLR